MYFTIQITIITVKVMVINVFFTFAKLYSTILYNYYEDIYQHFGRMFFPSYVFTTVL